MLIERPFSGTLDSMPDAANEPLPGRSRKRPPDERRALILEAARKAFAEASRPSQLSTVREIAAAGNMSEGTIYNYFTSKEELFAEAVVEPLRRCLSEVAHAPEAEADPAGEGARATGERFISVMLDAWAGSLPVLGMLLGDKQHASSFYADAFGSALGQLAASIDEHHGGRDLGFDGWVAARVIIGGCLMLALEVELGQVHVPRSELAFQMSAVMHHGLAAFFEPVPARKPSRSHLRPTPKRG